MQCHSCGLSSQRGLSFRQKYSIALAVAEWSPLKLLALQYLLMNER